MNQPIIEDAPTTKEEAIRSLKFSLQMGYSVTSDVIKQDIKNLIEFDGGMESYDYVIGDLL